jgi:hypothetical protein
MGDLGRVRILIVLVEACRIKGGVWWQEGGWIERGPVSVFVIDGFLGIVGGFAAC